mgnify:CR=1 FL=1
MLATKTIAPVAPATDVTAPEKSATYRNGMARLAAAVTIVTTDGREITRIWLTQMAANYDPARYGARVWIEHIRGIGPDSTFKAFGDVLALKVEKVEDGKLGLFAQIDPTPDLVALNKADMVDDDEILELVDTIFPVKQGSFVFGPMLMIAGKISCGTAIIATGDLSLYA